MTEIINQFANSYKDEFAVIIKFITLRCRFKSVYKHSLKTTQAYLKAYSCYDILT